MSTLEARIARQCLSALELDTALLDRVQFTGDGALPSVFPVTALAAATTAVATMAVAGLQDSRGAASRSIRVDRRLASFWFRGSIKPLGWEIPGPWDAIAGDYACGGEWIRLHTNAPAHRAAAQRVLGQHQTKAAMSGAVAQWNAQTLEEAVVAAGGCAATMLTRQQWLAHPQGAAVSSEPIVHLDQTRAARGPLDFEKPGEPATSCNPDRPLQGIRVLDLTRVLAGPVATRFLAGFGASVLRIDPPDWDEPAVNPEITPGKRCARLNLRDADARAQFTALLAEADVIVHGLRPGALEALGFGEANRQKLSPGIIDVSLNAYGWTGPWAGRRGFDSLVQMSSGIAHAGMQWQESQQPFPLPVQALDHATGYLLAAAVVRGLIARQRNEGATTARLSLARTAALLQAQLDGQPDAPAEDPPEERFEAISAQDYQTRSERTSWGEALRLKPQLSLADTPMMWDFGARQFGADTAQWDD